MKTTKMMKNSIRYAEMCSQAILNLIEDSKKCIMYKPSVSIAWYKNSGTQNIIKQHFDKLTFDDHCLIMEALHEVPRRLRFEVRELLEDFYYSTSRESESEKDVRLMLFNACVWEMYSIDEPQAFGLTRLYDAMKARLSERRERVDAALRMSLIDDLINIISAF